MKSKFTKTKIYVSYARETDEEIGIINGLKRLTRWMRWMHEVELIWDEKNINPGDSIRKFIENMSEGDKVVVVISDAYAKSPWCMTELREISNIHSNDDRKVIFPIVVGNCKLMNLRGSSEYQTQLEEELRKTKTKGIEEIIESLDKVLGYFSGLGYISFDKLESNNYKELKEFIRLKLPIWVWPTVVFLALCLLLSGGWNFYCNQKLEAAETGKRKTEADIKTLKSEEQKRLEKDIARRLSLGEKYFLEASFDKRIGAREFLFRLGDAKTGFLKSLNEVPDDPETQIYLENAQAKSNALADSGDQNQIRTIAVSVPIQKNVTVAKEILRGVAQAQKEINDQWREDCKNDPKNRAEDCGKRWLLQVLIASDDNDIEIAEGIAKHIANERKDILAVIGHNSSQVSNAVLKEYQNKLVMISPTSHTLNHSAKEIKDAESNYIFSITYPVQSVLPAIVDHIKSKASNQQKRNVYFCADPIAHDTDKLVEGLDQEIKSKDLKKYIVVEGITKENNKTVIECDISKLKSDKLSKEKLDKRKEKLTDLFLSVHVKNIIDGAIIARRNSNNNSLDLYNAYTLFSRDVLGEDLKGAIVAVNWHSKSSHDDNDSKKKSKEFIKNANCIWNGQKIKVNEDCPIGKFDPDIDLTWRSAMAYDATQLIIQGLSSVPLESKEDKARQELQQKVSEKVSKLEFTGVTGKVVFDQKTGSRDYDRINGKGHLVQVLARCDGKYQFVPIEKQNDSSYKLVFPEGVKFKDKTKSPKEQCA